MDLATRARRCVQEFQARWLRSAPQVRTLNVATLTRSAPAGGEAGSGRIQDLRAIPWVFGWTQCRLMLPGWYGSGTAFDALASADASAEAVLRRMYDRWPFFRTVMANMGMVLAKADVGIGTMYADALVPDEVLRRRVLDRIVTDLLDLARYESGVGTLEPRVFSVERLFEQVAARHERGADARSVTIATHVADLVAGGIAGRGAAPRMWGVALVGMVRATADAWLASGGAGSGPSADERPGRKLIRARDLHFAPQTSATVALHFEVGWGLHQGGSSCRPPKPSPPGPTGSKS